MVSTWGAGTPWPWVPPDLLRQGEQSSAAVAQMSCGNLLPASHLKKLVEAAVFTNTRRFPRLSQAGVGASSEALQGIYAAAVLGCPPLSYECIQSWGGVRETEPRGG